MKSIKTSISVNIHNSLINIRISVMTIHISVINIHNQEYSKTSENQSLGKFPEYRTFLAARISNQHRSHNM